MRKLTENTYVVVLFFVALAVRLALNTLFFQDHTQRDGVVYHNIAVNLVQGHGYSANTAPPYEPYFFREPAYPLLLAGVYGIAKKFGVEPDYLQQESYNLKEHPAIFWARIAQCLIGALTCVMLYLTFRLALNAKTSFWISVLFSFYTPLGIYTTVLMRETLQTFVVVSMNYFFARFLLHRKLLFLVLFSLAWAISNMTLQVTILIGVLVFIFLWYQSKSLIFSTKYTVLASLIMLVAISPWLIRSYQFHSDVRVLRSLGVSITYEAAQYSSHLGKLQMRGILSRDSVLALRREWYALSEEEKFSKSFNGYFSNRISELPNISFDLKSEILHRIDYFRRGWIESLWFLDTGRPEGRIKLRPHSEYLRSGNYFLFALSMSGFMFGYLAIPGMFLFFKRLWPIMLATAYFIPLSFIISDEARRMFPVHGFIFLLSCLAIIYFYEKLVNILRASRYSIVQGFFTRA